jgi:hypothetical protein
MHQEAADGGEMAAAIEAAGNALRKGFARQVTR